MDDSSSFSQDLIPRLPYDVALHCFLRFSLHNSIHTLQSVCRQWKHLLHNPHFYRQRKALNFTHPSLCLIQPIPTHNFISPDAVTVYDPLTHTSHTLPPIAHFQHRLPLFCHCLAVKDNVLLLGGWNTVTWEAMTCVHIFHFPTGKWRKGKDMLSVRSFFASGVIADGLVIVAGGHDNNKNALKTAEVYNVELDEWAALPEMSEERDECKGAVVEGKFYVISGYASERQGQFVRSADVFSAYSCRWERVEDFWPPAKLPEFVVSYKGRLVSCDGDKLMGCDFQKNAWEVMDILPEGVRNGACATVMRDDIFVAGTERCGEANAFLYEPTKRKWTRIPEFRSVVRGACTIEI